MLTITPSGTNTTTASACDSYTWSVNGQTYTASGTYTAGSGSTFYNSLSSLTSAVATAGYTLSSTETFNSITSGFYSSLTGNFGAGSPSWTANANGGLYLDQSGGSMVLSTNNISSLTIDFSPGVTSVGANIFVTDISFAIIPGTITLNLSDGSTESFSTSSATNFGGFVAGSAQINSITISTSTANAYVTVDNLVVSTGTIVPSSCVTEVLSLTITPSTSNTTTASACDSYTWSVDGNTYTQSGTYSSVSGCHTEILSLVIDNSVTYYADSDGDGYGNPNASQATCTGAPAGYVTDNGDCNDGDNAINPAATEVCNDGTDNNCDGQIDEGCGCLNPATVDAGADQTICSGDDVTLSGSFGGGASSASWSTSGDGTFSPNATTMSATYIPGAADIAAGSVSLTLTTNAPFQCPAESSTMVVTINAVPNAGPVSGSTSICTPGSNVFTYTIAPVAGATSYNWTVPAGTDVVSGQGTTSLSVRWPNSVVQAGVFGDICVTASNDCGSGATSCLTIGVQITSPVTPPSISGAAKVCPGATVTYSVSSVARAQYYNWSVPAGATIVSGNLTNIIQVQFSAGFTGGSVSVYASNACGSGPSRTRNVILDNPLTPTGISGQLTGLCGTSGATFTAASVSNATGYSWTVPAGATIVSGQGSATISVNFAGNFTSGNITVAATNGCGTGSARSATVIGAPGIPGVINGPSAVCTNGIVNYDVATVVGASTYTWSVPTGFTILSGQGTKNLQVRGGSSPGSGLTLSVRAINACGTGASRAKTGISVIQCVREGEGSALNLLAYPNPASDLLNVSFTSDKNQDVLVSMMDAAGRLVVVENRNADEGSNKFEFSVGGLASGIYTLQFRTADHVENIRVIVE